MKPIPHQYDPEAVTRRLQIVRFAETGDNQAEFARRLGVSRTRWNNIERGYPMSMQMAYMLTNLVEGLRIEWLTEGFDRYLTVDLRDRLERAEAELFTPRRGRRTGRPGRRSGKT